MPFCGATLVSAPPSHSPFRLAEILLAEKSIFVSAGNLKEVVGM